MQRKSKAGSFPNAERGASEKAFECAAGLKPELGAEWNAVPLASAGLAAVPSSSDFALCRAGGGGQVFTAVSASGIELSSNSSPQADGRDAAHFGLSSRAPAVGLERWAAE